MSLEIKNLQFQIGKKHILKDLMLEICEKEFVGLIGPNGCGKSTLLKHIYRSYKPEKGSIFLDGDDIMTLSTRKMAKRMAVMAQENHVEFDFSVQDMVMFGRYSRKGFFEATSADDLEKCRECLVKVGLEGYENRSFLSLSGGEKQRTLLARVLMQDSQWIILDEPTNHLDISYQYQIMEILKRQNVTVFTSIHDLNLAALYCDRIILMAKGEIVDYGTPEEVLTQENILTYYGIDSQITKNTATGKMQIYYLPGK